MSISKERLNLLFEMESIKSHLTYIAPGVSLKAIANCFFGEDSIESINEEELD